MAEIAVGIDLGTSNSCVSIARGGKVEVLPNAYGEPVTASVVAFDEKGGIAVGNAAKANVIHDPLNTVSSAKRLIGRYFFSEEVKKAQAVYSYGIVEGPSHSLRIQIRDEEFSLPEISAMVLREMKTIAEEQLGEEVQKAVITVPAYFNDNQRQATRDAGRIAGLEVLRLLNEPTAAALAYGFGLGLSQRVAVYDLGGGTFDISVLEIGKDVFEVLSTCGDTYLGGEDFDDRLIDLLADEFVAKEGLNLRNDPFALEKLKVAAETGKKGLSVEEQVEIRIPDIAMGPDGEPRSITRSITRDEYSSLVMDLVQRTFKVCDEALQQANMVARDLGGVILVGGSTRLSVIRKAVGEYFQQEPRGDVDPDEVVAMGAAIHAASLCSTEEQESVLLDVTPLSLRIGVAGGLAETVIGCNTPVPIEQTRTFTTYQDFQESVKIRVFQGESRQAKENEMLGQFEFSGFKKARRGEVRIDVTFEIDSDGIVNVTACDQETGQQASTQLTLSSGLSEEEIDQIIDEGRTDRVRGGGAVEGEGPAPVEASNPTPVEASSPAPVEASNPTPEPEEELSDELELLPEPADLLEELPDLEVDDEEVASALAAEGEETDPNAATQPDQEPLAVTAAPEAAAEVELDPADLKATAAENLEEIQPPGNSDGIQVDDLDGSPDDEIEIQTGAASLFEEAGVDLSVFDDEESER